MNDGSKLHATMAMAVIGCLSTTMFGALPVDDDGQHRVRKHVVMKQSDGGEAKEIQVEVIDGKARVMLNGEEIATENIEMDGTHGDHMIIFTDEDGNVHKVGGGGGNTWVGENDFVFEVDGAEGMAWEFRGEQPTVMVGIHMDRPGPALAHHLRIDLEQATLVSRVIEGLPADNAGIEAYDIIIGVDGEDSGSAQVIQEVLAGKEPGDRVELRVIQRGKKKVIELQLDEYDPEALNSFVVDVQGIPDMLFQGEGDGPLIEFDVRAFRDGDVFFAPDSDVWAELEDLPNALRFGDDMDGQWFHIRERMQRDGHGHDADHRHAEDHDAAHGHDDDVDGRIERMTRRIKELEAMLEELLDG